MGMWRSLIVALSLASAGGVAAQTGPGYDGDLIYEPTEASPRWDSRHRDPQRLAAAEEAVARFNSPTLTRFAGDEEFRRYLGAVLAAERARDGWYASLGPVRFAQSIGAADVQSDAVEPICPPEDPNCGAPIDDSSDMITVTGSRIRAPSNRAVPAVTNGQITNNQMRNVEEGDIVKQINQYLLVLQDGRIFVIDTRGGSRGGRKLVLADRANVYRDARENMWYDEMLVFGDRVLITGYSYREDATELSVFRLDTASGRLSREGVFHMSSNDYYSSSNYATRLIGDNLVIYTPFEVSDMAHSTFRWPVVRRWVGEEERDDAIERGRPLFDAAQVYRPVRSGEDPTVHTVSVCPLGQVGADRDLECRTTAFVGPNTSQWYVTETDAFLWTTSRDYYSYDSQACDAPDLETDLQPALVYRVPVDGARPGLVGARGVPPDQFSLHSVGGRLLALLKARQRSCDDERDPEARLAYLDVPLSSFGDTVRETPWQSYTPLPGVGSHFIANRFTDRYLVYGSLGRYRRGLAEKSRPPVYAVPVDRPGEARGLGVGHTVVRAEQAGSDIVLTGYRDNDGLFVTLIDLDRQPRIASSVRLEKRFESEGRSHAFNSLIEADGSGVMGLPTIGGETWSSRAAWRSSASDLSFLKVDSSGRLRPIGELERRFEYGDDKDVGIPGYSCEVSCIDWYGNSRPIFTDGRVFALTGTEMIEGRIYGDEIMELQRLNIARASIALAGRSAPSPGGGD